MRDSKNSHFSGGIPHENPNSHLNLRLVGIKNAYAHRYSFLLLLDDLRIRALDPFKIHINRNPHREKIFPPHKHKWCDLYKDTIAYHPDDITDPSNIELTFMQFVKECNITMEGKFNHPPQVQMELPI